jgi:hypothetical protein
VSVNGHDRKLGLFARSGDMSVDGHYRKARQGPGGMAGLGRQTRRGEAGLMAASRASQRAPTSEPWLTKRELADVFHCSTRTIERLRPPALRVGGQNRYRLSQVEAFLRRGERQVQLVLFGMDQDEEPTA